MILNNSDTAELLNLPRNYFSLLKSNDMDLYTYLTRNGIHLYHGWNNYNRETATLKIELERIYYELLENGKVSELAKLGNEIYASEASTRNSIENILFGLKSNERRMGYKTFLRVKILLYRWHKKNKTEFNFEK